MPSDPLQHSPDHFHAELAAELTADPGIQDALRQLNELHVPDPREQRFDATKPSRFYRGVLIGICAALISWAGLIWTVTESWNW